MARRAGVDGGAGGGGGPCDDAGLGESEWGGPRYRNRGGLDDYLGDTQPAHVEVLAVRIAQYLNGCRTLDWTHENWLTTLLRELGPGLRVGYFLTAFSVVVIASIALPNPPLFMFPLRMDTLETRFADLTMTFAMLLWTFDFAVLCWAYYWIRHNATPARMHDNSEWVPFLRVPTLRTREDREQDEETLYRSLVRGLAAAFYATYFFLGVLATHTLLSHMYRARNPYLAAVLLIQSAFALLSSLDDLTQIGSPWGIQECSKWASCLLCMRGLYLIPATLIWTGCAVAASFPPSYCIEC